MSWSAFFDIETLGPGDVFEVDAAESGRDGFLPWR